MVLKNYQEELLDAYSAYLSRCREVGAETAFRESARSAFGHEVPYSPLPGAPDVPYVCMRVPTGGGKTLIGGHAIRRVLDSYLPTENSLVLWLVPSDAIREQTLYVLRTPGELLHDQMRELFGKVNVLDISEALHVTPSTLATANTIIVSTMQSFKRSTPEGLKVYQTSGSLMAHFENKAKESKGDCSLVDVIRLHKPFVIVDEAHNAGTPLAVDTLVRFSPSCVLELTATPDRKVNPSNVLRSITASELQAAHMLKIPLELAIGPNWHSVMAEAINRVRDIENDAEEERKLTGEIIEPIVMLIQGESAQAGQERFTPPVIKQHLIDDFKIPADKIAIEYKEFNELAGKRLGDADFPQFVITVDKLREGWDCPVAYVLFSFRSTTSSTAVEQVLGRILRMPHVKRKENEALNRSYAYAVSQNLVDTVKSLKDGLVQSGFERIDAQELLSVADLSDSALFPMRQDVSISLPVNDGKLELPDTDKFELLPNALRSKIDIVPERGTITVRDGVTAKQIEAIANSFRDSDISKIVKERFEATVVSSNDKETTPAERGERVNVPRLMLRQGKLFEQFDESALLDSDWEITEFDCKLSESEFETDNEALRRASMSISQTGKIIVDPYERLEAELALFDYESGWSHEDLVHWLDRQIPFVYAERGQKVAWLNETVNYLIDKREFSVEELAYRKFRLRGAIERKLKSGLVQTKQRVFDDFLSDESSFEVRNEHSFTFSQASYAYDFHYAGVFRLKRHFFPVIGNLKDSGEEFNCAQEIANHLPNVEWWIRNVERKSTSFWLQTASDRFYPDFLIRLYGGITVAVEYKGAHIADTRESREKKQIGELWARRSNGRCRFAWVENQNWQALHEAVK